MINPPIFPKAPSWQIPWETIETVFREFVTAMSRTEQNPAFHGEGDVWTHTKLVCEALTGMNAFRALPSGQQQAVFLAALLHDVGKPSVTRWEEGSWTSPNHSAVGAKTARGFLWRQLGLCGSEDRRQFRETVCTLIRWHALPMYAIDDPEGKRKLRSIAAKGALCPDFTVELLCLLARADALGRVCSDKDRLTEQVALCSALAEETGCLRSPWHFPSDHTRHAWLSGRNVSDQVPLYDDTWGQVMLLSGLPGTGKDTWIRENLPGIPVISLDEIRKDAGIAPTENQSRVVELAREKAREYLRSHRSFVWNATNITPMVRRKQLELFEAYGASVRIVYLETGWAEQLRRNRERTAMVPEQVICRLLEELEPPEPGEAVQVDWYSV